MRLRIEISDLPGLKDGWSLATLVDVEQDLTMVEAKNLLAKLNFEAGVMSGAVEYLPRMSRDVPAEEDSTEFLNPLR